MSDNIPLTDAEFEFIKKMDKFDLTMLLSETHDHGWYNGGRLLMTGMYHAVTGKDKGFNEAALELTGRSYDVLATEAGRKRVDPLPHPPTAD